MRVLIWIFMLFLMSMCFTAFEYAGIPLGGLEKGIIFAVGISIASISSKAWKEHRQRKKEERAARKAKR